MEALTSFSLQFIKENKDVLSLLVPVIIPFWNFIWATVKHLIHFPEKLKKSDYEYILEFFSKENLEKLKLEHKVIQDITIQKVSFFKNYSIEKIERLLNANIGDNNSFLFFELNKLGFLNDYGKITTKGCKYISKQKIVRCLWWVWVIIGSLLIIYIQFFSAYRDTLIIISWIVLPFTEIYLLNWGNRINQIKKFSYNQVNVKMYNIEINREIFIAKVYQN